MTDRTRNTPNAERKAPKVTVTLTRAQVEQLDTLEVALAPEVAKMPPHDGGQAPRGRSGTLGYLIERAWEQLPKKARRS